MSGSYLYLVAVAIYLVFFGLFIRFFIWKRYADRCYWNRRPLLDVAKLREEAVRRGKEVPRFSILIPARNEADVIARTVDHMCRLQYPADRYEVVVVTDQKERLAREEVRPRLVAEAVSSLGGRGTAPALGEAEAAASGAQAAGGRARPVGSRAQASMLALGLLTRCGQAHWQPGSRLSRTLGWVPGTRLPAEAERNLVRELAWHIVHHRGKVSPGRLLFLVRRAYNGSPVEWARRAYPCYLAASLPVVVAYLHLLRQPIRPVLSRLARKVLPLPAATSRQVVLALSGAVARHIVREVVRLRRAGALAAALDEVFPESFPTTQDVVQASLRKLAGGARQPGRPREDCPQVREVEVPYDYDGSYGGPCLGRPVPSTKGRALNWALATVSDDVDLCAFYDAESRPDPRVLMYVAYRYLTEENPPAIFQGPVFQVRNFFQMSPVCKVAALYQAVAHDWYLPVLFRRLPFVGGTNLVVKRDLLQSIGGFDPACLTEDLELGVRAYLDRGVWPAYLPYPSSEQTPPTVRAFFRQRLRWGTGHLLVMDKVRASRQYEEEKREQLLHILFLKGQVEWVAYQLATFVPPAVLLLLFTGHLDVSNTPAALRYVLNVMSTVYAGFTFYTYRRYSGYVDTWCRPLDWPGRVWVWLQLLILPLAAFLFPTPYATALVLKKLGKHPRQWTKTPRSKE